MHFLYTIIRLIRSVLFFNFKNSPKRVVEGTLSLIPLIGFYTGHGFINYFLMKSIDEYTFSLNYYLFFSLTLASVDALGDSIIYASFSEYNFSLRRGQCLSYFLNPGPLFMKVAFFRIEVPFVLFSLSLILFQFFYFTMNLKTFLFYLLSLVFAFIIHIVLTGSYLIIQAFFDPKMPIPLGNPLTRYYTKPISLFIKSSYILLFLTVIYPAMYVTSGPTDLVLNLKSLPPYLSFSLILGACLSLAFWCFLCSFLIRKSILKRQN